MLVSFFEGIGEDSESIKIKYSGPDTDGYHDYVDGFHFPSQGEQEEDEGGAAGVGAGGQTQDSGTDPNSEEESDRDGAQASQSAGDAEAPGPAWPLSYWEVAGAGASQGVPPVPNPYYMYDEYWVGGGGFSFSNIDDIVPGTQLETRDWGKWERAFAGSDTQSGQWIGWRTPVESGKFAKVFVFIKFIDSVPEVSDNMGIKIQGQVVNDWVAGLLPDVWHCVGASAPTAQGGDANHFLLIFDSVPGPQVVHVGGMTMKIFDSESDASAAECGLGRAHTHTTAHGRTVSRTRTRKHARTRTRTCTRTRMQAQAHTNNDLF